MPAALPARKRNLDEFGKSLDTKHQGCWISGTLILLNILVLAVWTLSRLYKPESLKSSVSLVYSLEVPASPCIWENVLENQLSICCQWKYAYRLQVLVNLLHSAPLYWALGIPSLTLLFDFSRSSWLLLFWGVLHCTVKFCFTLLGNAGKAPSPWFLYPLPPCWEKRGRRKWCNLEKVTESPLARWSIALAELGHLPLQLRRQSYFMDLQLSLLFQSLCCLWYWGACTLAQSGSSPFGLWLNPKPPQGNDRSSTNAPACMGAAPLANAHQCPLVYERREEGCLRMESATAGWEGQMRMQDLDTKKDVKLQRKHVKISCHGCYQNPVVAVPTINAFHPVSSILSSHGDLPLMHPWKHFSYFFSSACIH